jgi:dTDP-4-amino-4,6-dideoxygalactose transaminase
MVARRREQAHHYCELLADIPSLGLPVEPTWAHSNWQSFCVRLPEGSDQRRVMQVMLDKKIATRRGVMCSHREPAYPPGTWRCGQKKCDCLPHTCKRLVNSETAEDRAILLPLFHEMTLEQQGRVVRTLKDALAG